MEKINASIITIGDELLIGQVVDTNSAWIGKRLLENGIWVSHKFSVGDQYEDIWHTLDIAAKESQVIIITGGLGPTADDITKPLLCSYFEGKMIEDKDTLDHITHLFQHVFKRSMPLLESNRRQAEVPDVCTVLKNEIGTAPGMLFEKNGKYFFSLPGVPYEMQILMQNQVLPFLQIHFKLPPIAYRTLLTFGIGESLLAEKIKDFEASLPHEIKLAYLPNFGMLRLRLTAQGVSTEILESAFDKLKELTKEWLVVPSDITMQEVVAHLFFQNKKTLATAESCTGGYIAHLLTAIPNASEFFKGSTVAYSNYIKSKVLNVKSETLEKVGAVSEETVREMVSGTLAIMNTDYALAVSGIMGPGGGTKEKPIGTVWIAVGNNDKIVSKIIHVRFDRERNIHLTAIQALNFLREFILEKL
ncbi:MAG: CinA family nicotinamide mononucleotide deamidase-related protein [Bacteroidetes bacterium]|nr:CinA family nicotinamide mononucleotide deamidase-related protein [Bacteroidota bacterium]